MSDKFVCPQCHTELNHGVLVCVGCQGSVHYGATSSDMKGAFILSIILAIMAKASTSYIIPGKFSDTIAWAIAFIAFIVCFFKLVQRLSGKITVIRHRLRS